MSFLSKFSLQIAKLLPHVKTDLFIPALVDMFKELVPTNNIMVIVYPSKSLPRIEYNDLPAHRVSIVDKYVKGAFLLDPYYLAASKQEKVGFFHLSALSPDGFDESEYNQVYFKFCGLYDECGYIFQLDDEGKSFVNISLGRIDETETFCDNDLKRLSEITPLIEALVKCNWQAEEIETDHQPDLRKQLETALECFGTSILTERENQMVQMILHGYSSKAIAARFNISVETVKLHRKNAYAKLDLSTQGELFNLFINSLMNVKNYEDGDPLITYHSSSKS
ncbi:MAG: LuxR C-terminal-related transcriptional regulator [Kangiellaceae bacterium]|nr:LuxR C-terminal-related transcriptional regulator [Kangiellaceae bacterium]